MVAGASTGRADRIPRRRRSRFFNRLLFFGLRNHSWRRRTFQIARFDIVGRHIADRTQLRKLAMLRSSTAIGRGERVGVVGFELTTTGTQSRPSTRLRYTPENGADYSRLWQGVTREWVPILRPIESAFDRPRPTNPKGSSHHELR